MGFPETRFTLIHRLASFNNEEDWRLFLGDYWEPVCRFALRWGARGEEEAEDIASQTFEILWTNRLLVRWVANRSAKLRTLLCAVVRKLIANRQRVETRREELVREIVRYLDEQNQSQPELVDQFYAIWADEIIRRAFESVSAEYCAEGGGNSIRVLHGRLFQKLTFAALAERLHSTVGEVDNLYRQARNRLVKALQDLLHEHVSHYCQPEEIKGEFEREWQLLHDYLDQHGGMGDAVTRARSLLDAAQRSAHSQQAITRTLTRLSKTPPEGIPQG